MRRNVCLWSAIALCSTFAWGAAAPPPAQTAPPPAPAAAVNPAEGCRAIGLFVFDVKSNPLTIVVVPKYLPVGYPKNGETAREVCFSVVLVNGDKNDKFEQLKLKAFDSIKGRGGKPLFTEKKVHPASADLISLEFNDVPDWDADGDGVLEDIVQSFDIEAKFKGKTVVLDPDIVIKKPGG